MRLAISVWEIARLPPQQSVLRDQSTGSAPSTRTRRSIPGGFSASAEPVSSGGRVSRHP